MKKKLCLYMVSIPEVEERRSNVLNLQKRLEKKFECFIVDAFLWRNHDVFKILQDEKIELEQSSPTSLSQIGCFLSHRKVWQQIASSTNKDAIHIIIEDDMTVIDDFEQKVSDFIDQINRPIDAVIMWKHPHQEQEQLKQEIYDGCMSSFYFQWGLCSYMITQEFASILVSSIQKLTAPIDLQLAHCIFPYYRVFIAIPQFFINLGDLGTGFNQHKKFSSCIWKS